MSELVPLGGDRRPPARKLATFVMVDEPRSSAQASPEGMGLREALGILRRRLWLIILFTTIGGGLGYFLAQRQAPVYSARAVIRVQDPTTQMGGQLAAQSYAWALTDPVRSTLEVLKSQSVLGGIVDRTSIRLVSLDPDFTVSSLERVRVNEFAQMDTIQLTFDAAGVEAASMRTGARARATYDSTLDLGAISFTARRPPPGAPPVVRMALRDRQQAISTVDSGLNAVLRPQTNVVDVDFTAADAYLAQQVVNEAVSVFEEQSTLDARQVVTRRRSFLEVQLAEADTILRISQQALSEFRTRAQVFSSQQRAVAQQSGLMSVEVREEELRADRQMYVALLDGLRAAPTDGEASERLQSLIAVPDLAQNPLISSLSSQLLDYELEREALTSGPWAASTQNPDIVRLDQLIRSTHERLEVAIQSHIQQLDARAAALAGLRDRTAGQITGLPEAEAEEARYLQEVEASRRTVEQLREELYRAQLAEAIELGPVNVLDLAPLPTGS
ncbi:MAG TPA: Wzz/FepE/Etk N-terminal domain-containing protein, partial [Longimicrobiales bacterium]|nr:Wzz/FepE/Etk N-terminal domain-containing protein [Longimicrobiales bacterium]